MRTATRVLLLIASLLVSSATAADPPKTGEFETTFTERSPLSAKKDLLGRLNHKQNVDDYDLSKEPFLVYVPADYDAANAYGLIIWINHKDVSQTPAKWRPVLDKSKLIFVVTKSAAQEDWIRCGLALDAVHNLKKLYNIDDTRVYLFAQPAAEKTLGQKMGLTFADVFDGFVYVYNQRYFRPIPIPNSQGMSYQSSFTRPQAPYFNQAKTRKHVIVADPKFADVMKLVYKAYQEDGIRQILFMEASVDQVDYPDLQPAWLEKVLAFFEGNSTGAEIIANAQPATAPTSRPSAAGTVPEPQSMLNVAKTYLGIKNYAAARTKLKDLIVKYPNDPAANEARQLLEQIKDK